MDGACGGGACAGGVCVGRACADGACDIIYGKSPASVPLGNGRFIYIKGPIRLEILLSLNEAKNLLVLIWSRISSLVYSVWLSLYSISYKDYIIVTRLSFLTYTP